MNTSPTPLTPENAGPSLADTGERLLTHWQGENVIEHLHRYAIAAEWCDGKAVLDIASGEGYGSHLLAKRACEVTGVDISQDTITHAQKTYRRSNLRFLAGSAENIPLPDASIDVAVSFETLEHIVRHDQMLREIRRVLRPEGMLIISTPDKAGYSEARGYTNPYHLKELDRAEFRNLMRDYFGHVAFLGQKVVYASVIVPEELRPGFREYSGDFQEIRACDRMEAPVYNLCIASQHPLNMDPVGITLFATEAVLKDQREVDFLNGQIQILLQSTSYRLGQMLTLHGRARRWGRALKKRADRWFGSKRRV